MSGIFGQVAPVQVPDFGATLARAQGMQANRLAMLAQQRQMTNEDALQGFFAQNAAGFANADPQARMNLLAQLAAQPGGARMALPMMQTLREEMEWSGAGQTAAPSAAPVVQPAASGSGGFSENGLAINTRSESGGDPNARPRFPDGTPRSSATGPNQFIDGTWLAFARANPQLFQGMTREQVLAARSNPQLSAQATQWYARRNAAHLQQAGVPVNDATLGLAHQFDGPVAARIATAPPNTPIEQIVGQAAMRANPDLAGQTAGQVVQRFGARYGGNATPAQAGGAPSAAPREGGLPDVPGFDMARVRRAINLPNNAAAQRYLQSYMQAAGLVRRGEAEPLERVRRPDGNEVLVPRSQASGMVSAPNPRETPGPFGSGERGRSLQAIEELGQTIARGDATPEQLMRYGSAVTNYQQEEIRPDGSRVTPRLPPYAPPLDWVAQRYPSFQFNAQPAAPGQQQAPQAAQPAAAPMGDATPAAPSLPAAGASQGLPGAGGTVSRDPAAMEGGTRRQIEEQAVASQDRISRLAGIERSYDPQMQTYGNRWSNMWSALRERSGAQLSPQERQRLTAYTQGRAAALENLNRTIQETTGAAMSEGEAARITATMPNPGTGLFDGDSPTEFQAKLQRAINATRNALVRQNYALSRGLNPTQTGIELDEIPRLYERRGREIEAELRQGNADADQAQLRQHVRVRLRQEFGI